MSTSSSSLADSTTFYTILITVIENYLSEEGYVGDKSNGEPQAPIAFKSFSSLAEANEAAKLALWDFLGADEPEEEDLTEDGCYVPYNCLPEGVSMTMEKGGAISIFCEPAEEDHTAYEVSVIKSQLEGHGKPSGKSGKKSALERQ